MTTETIHIGTPIHMGVFARLLRAISLEFPGATLANTPDGTVAVTVDPTNRPEPDHELLHRLAAAADDLAGLDPDGPLERDIRAVIDLVGHLDWHEHDL